MDCALAEHRSGIHFVHIVDIIALQSTSLPFTSFTLWTSWLLSRCGHHCGHQGWHFGVVWTSLQFASVWQQSSDSTWSGLQRRLASVPQVPSRSSASSLPIISFPLRFSFNAWPGLRRILASVRQQSPNFLCLTGTTSQFGFSPEEIFGFHSWPGLRRSLASVRQFPIAVFSLDQR